MNTKESQAQQNMNDGNPAVRNIAITGDYGIGKSNLIRWFELEYDACKEQSDKRFRQQQKQACENGFLYISLGQYRDS